jgi:hypothetical protein
MIDDHRFGQARYSIGEIDGMRQSLLDIEQAKHGFTTDATHTIVEIKLRTHMLNGTPHDDLRASADEAKRERAARILARRAKIAADAETAMTETPAAMVEHPSLLKRATDAIMGRSADD